MSKEIEPIKLHLLDKRNELILGLHHMGYSGTDVASIFNIHRSWVNRIIKLSKK